MNPNPCFYSDPNPCFLTNPKLLLDPESNHNHCFNPTFTQTSVLSQTYHWSHPNPTPVFILSLILFFYPTLTLCFNAAPTLTVNTSKM